MIYEYFCENHKEFEIEQKINDQPLQECPHCKKEGKKSSPPKKLISLGSFSLKGGGVGWASSGYSK